jgi:hypothetical protein
VCTVFGAVVGALLRRAATRFSDRPSVWQKQ